LAPRDPDGPHLLLHEIELDWRKAGYLNIEVEVDEPLQLDREQLPQQTFAG